MIKHLYSKIRWIIFIPISLLLCVGISLFLYSACNNTIDITARIYNKFNQDLTISSSFSDTNPVYKVLIESDGTVLANTEMTTSDTIYKIAKTVSHFPIKQGVVSKYVYTVNNTNRGKEIVLIENQAVVSRLKSYIYRCLTILAVLLVLVWFISKYLADLIVKPVEESFNKQKMFISDASHELKTPLAVISANMDVLENKNGSSKWSQYIVQEVNSMNKLVNDLLILSKTEDVEATKQLNNLSQLIAIDTSVFESLAYEKQLTLNTDIQDDLYCQCNSDDIERIVSVLVDNAIKHSTQSVNVSLSQDKHNIILTVSNTGEEISLEDQKRIFDRFYRVDKARNRQEKRYGLGLSIAKAAANRNNATITVESENHVTSFIVTFKQNHKSMNKGS